MINDYRSEIEESRQLITNVYDCMLHAKRCLDGKTQLSMRVSIEEIYECVSEAMESTKRADKLLAIIEREI